MRTCATSPRHMCPECVSIEDICLTAALSCPSTPSKMAQRWPRDFTRVCAARATVPCCRRRHLFPRVSVGPAPQEDERRGPGHEPGRSMHSAASTSLLPQTKIVLGASNLLPQRRRLLELAVRAALLLDHVDSGLVGQRSLINARSGSLVPVLTQRPALADHLAQVLKKLGLDREPKEMMDLTAGPSRRLPMSSGPCGHQRAGRGACVAVAQEEPEFVRARALQGDRPGPRGDAGPHVRRQRVAWARRADVGEG